MNKGLLDGIRVVECSSYAACANVGKLLGLWGADVIKVESPKGDIFRTMGGLTNLPMEEDENPAFMLCNSNKRGVTIDTKTPEGKEVLFKLLETADVFLSNIRMQSLEKLGLGWEDIHSRFPKMVYCHLSGWGPKGPQAGEPGFDTACYWAVSGALADLAPAGGPPIPPSYGVGDQHSAAYGAGAISAALLHAMRTGEGTYVAPSLLGVSTQGHGMMTTYCQKAYTDRGYGMKYPIGHFNPSYPTFNSYLCKDGEWIMLTLTEYEQKLEKFCKAIGISESVYKDPRYNTVKSVQEPENNKTMVAYIDEAISKYTSKEAVELFKENDIVATTYVHFTDFAVNKQAHANGYFEYFTFDNGETISLPANPVLFNNGEYNQHLTACPKLGEHNREILTELGLSESDMDSLRDKKVII